MEKPMRHSRSVPALPESGRDALILGAPWSSGDAVAICAELTGVVVQVCRSEEGRLPEDTQRYGGGRGERGVPASGPEPCRVLAQEGLRGLPRTRHAPYRYRCPKGVSCACIPLEHSPARCRAHIWVRACPGPGCLCQPRPSSKAGGKPDLSERFADDAFELAVNLLAVMSGSVRRVAGQPSPARQEAKRLNERQKGLVRQVCQAVHTRCPGAGLRLGPLAAESAVSVAYLCTLFAKAVGVPFREYLQASRMLDVRGWLAEGQLSVKEIAARAGYNDPNRLRLAFKAATGLALRAWRERRLAESAYAGRTIPDPES